MELRGKLRRKLEEKVVETRLKEGSVKRAIAGRVVVAAKKTYKGAKRVHKAYKITKKAKGWKKAGKMLEKGSERAEAFWPAATGKKMPPKRIKRKRKVKKRMAAPTQRYAIVGGRAYPIGMPQKVTKRKKRKHKKKKQRKVVRSWDDIYT